MSEYTSSISPLEYAVSLLSDSKKGSFYFREMCSTVMAMWPKKALTEKAYEEYVVNKNPEILMLYIADLTHAGTIHERAGLASMLIGMMNIAMIGKTTQEDWDNTLKTKMKILDRAKREGKTSIADATQQEIGLIPFRTKEWLYHTEVWNLAYEKNMSPEAINGWIKESLAEERAKKQSWD